MTAESFKNRVAAVQMKHWQIRQDLICAAIEWDRTTHIYAVDDLDADINDSRAQRDARLSGAIREYHAASKEFIGKSSEDIAREQEAEAEGK